jgi:integrase/recombinase XerC
VRMTTAIDVFVKEMAAEGRFNSARTEEGYRATLVKHAEDVGNRDPRTVGRDDVKRTLQRWRGNTRALYHAHLASFYDFAMESGWRKDNPARQVRRTKVRKPHVYRLTRDEVRLFRAAARTDRDRTIADFGLLAGLRAQELLGLQGRHLRRPGWVWVSADIAKGGRERWVPVLEELVETWERCAQTASGEFVLASRAENWQEGVRAVAFDASRPMSYQALYKAVGRIGRRAGIAAPVHPHLLRHAFGDHIARFAGIKVAQFVLGHQSVATTERYTGQPSLDEVSSALAEFGYGLPPTERPLSALVEPAGTFQLKSAVRDPVRDWGASARSLAPVLAWMWLNPTIRAAARGMAHV